ncbi:hypothetical protein SAMN05216391_10921 [Lachnospiraceae bacterium KHCPX20]|nr:hypothetical protein SAMN05216391_10921 [Lachnospiraceae bacterium KHCPX20]
MIAVKGMEMPKNCMECDFRKSDPFSSEVYCNKLSCNGNIIIYEDERLDNCPLVEVVTCEHCKHNCDNTCTIDGCGIADDYFCASAERRE